MVGGMLVALTGADGRPAYELIFAMVGLAEMGLAVGSIALLRGFGVSTEGQTAQGTKGAGH
jgi:hypothetical protein